MYPKKTKKLLGTPKLAGGHFRVSEIVGTHMQSSEWELKAVETPGAGGLGVNVHAGAVIGFITLQGRD